MQVYPDTGFPARLSCSKRLRFRFIGNEFADRGDRGFGQFSKPHARFKSVVV